MIKKFCLTGLFLLSVSQSFAFANSEVDEFKRQAYLDSQPYMKAVGKLSHTIDGNPVDHGDACKLGRHLLPEEFVAPSEAKELASFTIQAHFDIDSSGIGYPESEFHIHSSGLYENVSGPAGLARRSVDSKGQVIYTSPTSHMAGFMESCGAVVHISNPIFSRKGTVIFGQGFVQMIYTFKCNPFGRDHVIVETCQF